MFTHKKITPYIFIFLAFCVISSKHIIIYNEEILVALSFLFFVIFISYYFADNIKSYIDERSVTIKSQLQDFLNLKKDILNNLYKMHEKAFLCDKIIFNLNNFTHLKVKNNSNNSEKALKSIFSTQINNKLKNISYSNFNFKSKLQNVISQQLLTAVLIKIIYNNTKNKNVTNNALNFNDLKKAIHSFSK